MGIPFLEINVLEDHAAYARMREISRQSLTPTLEWNNRVLADFGPPELEEFVGAGHLDDIPGLSLPTEEG